MLMIEQRQRKAAGETILTQLGNQGARETIRSMGEAFGMQPVAPAAPGPVVVSPPITVNVAPTPTHTGPSLVPNVP